MYTFDFTRLSIVDLGALTISRSKEETNRNLLLIALKCSVTEPEEIPGAEIFEFLRAFMSQLDEELGRLNKLHELKKNGAIASFLSKLSKSNTE